MNRNDELIGIFELEDILKPDAQDIVAKLKQEATTVYCSLVTIICCSTFSRETGHYKCAY
ncbi:MAG: hypothetical protein CM1200mP10_26210 [Candidatus Neomarinimicrobiota bacterium]|nr:MAG: hypothetical protein CM1200mP10_26210 [Candidatus Neomarinimicrobiota bacterium]